MVLGECGGGEGECGGGEGGASHAGIWVALPPKRKLRPWLMQQAALNVICAQYSWQLRPLSGCEGACGLRWCGLRGLAWGATRTKNSDLPSKKNETVFLFCLASRASGSVGLSPPTPCSDPQNLPAHAGEGGRLLATRREEGAAPSAAKGACGDGARLC